MKKTNKDAPLDWKDALGNIKAGLLKEGEAKRKRQKDNDNALRPYFNKAANLLGISQQQLSVEIKKMEPNLKEILTDRRLKASTYAKLIKKHNPAYYNLFEEKIKSAVKAEQRYFLEKRDATAKALIARPLESVPQKQSERKTSKPETAKKKKVKKPKALKKKVLQQPFKPVPIELTQWIRVDWHDVVFEDYLIKVKYGVNYSQGFPLSESRKSFRFLKKYIKNLQLPPLSIMLVGREIRKIENAEQVKEMATLLRIKEQLVEDFEKGKTTSAASMLEKIGPVSKHFLTQMAIAGNGELLCIEYLASQLAENFKPIPAFEIIPSGNSVTTEDTFIFVVERQSQLFLVWESTVHGRATYIFKATMDNYIDGIQAIYDYISSPRKAKRMALRRKDSETSNLGYDGYVTHSAFDHWQQKLEIVFNSQ